MKIFLIIALLSATVKYAAGQNGLVLNNAPYITFASSPIDSNFLVIENNAPNAIIEVGGNANIVAENERNNVRWYVGSQTGVYRIPFTTALNFEIPFEMDIQSSGTSGEFIDFSTYPTDVLNFPRPLGVINMNGGSSGTDQSLSVIDRFWLVDTEDYITPPSANFTFGYDPSETTGNTVAPGNMVAQSYIDSQNSWSGPNGQYGVDQFPTENEVTNAVVLASEMNRVWTLVDVLNPLPVVLSSQIAFCKDGQHHIQWRTESESNSSHFFIEQSFDLENWTRVYEVSGAGWTSSESEYEVIISDVVRNDVAYYQITQVDFDGAFEEFGVLSTAPCDEYSMIDLYVSSNGLINLVSNEKVVNVKVIDSFGRSIYNKSIAPSNGYSIKESKFWSSGVYSVIVQMKNGEFLTKRISI